MCGFANISIEGEGRKRKGEVRSSEKVEKEERRGGEEKRKGGDGHDIQGPWIG